MPHRDTSVNFADRSLEHESVSLATGLLLLSDGSSYLLLSDGVSRLKINQSVFKTHKYRVKQRDTLVNIREK